MFITLRCLVMPFCRCLAARLGLSLQCSYGHWTVMHKKVSRRTRNSCLFAMWTTGGVEWMDGEGVVPTRGGVWGQKNCRQFQEANRWPLWCQCGELPSFLPDQSNSTHCIRVTPWGGQWIRPHDCSPLTLTLNLTLTSSNPNLQSSRPVS